MQRCPYPNCSFVPSSEQDETEHRLQHMALGDPYPGAEPDRPESQAESTFKRWNRGGTLSITISRGTMVEHVLEAVARLAERRRHKAQDLPIVSSERRLVNQLVSAYEELEKFDRDEGWEPVPGPDQGSYPEEV